MLNTILACLLYGFMVMGIVASVFGFSGNYLMKLSESVEREVNIIQEDSELLARIYTWFYNDLKSSAEGLKRKARILKSLLRILPVTIFTFVSIVQKIIDRL